MKTCVVEGCGKVGKLKRGMCMKHYTRWIRYGDPLRERRNLAHRFASKYRIDDASGCWIWTAATTRFGYGVLQLGVKKQEKAHRVSWELFNGRIQDGLMIRHRCDTPNCVNPNHLQLGTHDDNMRDMVARGRSCARSKNPNCKLSEADVALVLCSQERAPSLAAKFGVHPETIRRIRRNENWKRDVHAVREVHRRMTFAMEAA